MNTKTPITILRMHNRLAARTSQLSTATAGFLAAGTAMMLAWTGTASATPPKDFNSDVTKAFFEKIRVRAETGSDVDDPGKRLPVFGHGKHKRFPGWFPHREDPRVKIIAKDPSDVYVVINTVAPGGYSGWHTHPGPSVVLVKTGAATVYDGDDPNCTAVTYPAGTGFIDPGDGHVHMVRNEGIEPLVTAAFQIIPTGEARRIDAASSGYCAF